VGKAIPAPTSGHTAWWPTSTSCIAWRCKKEKEKQTQHPLGCHPHICKRPSLNLCWPTSILDGLITNSLGSPYNSQLDSALSNGWMRIQRLCPETTDAQDSQTHRSLSQLGQMLFADAYPLRPRMRTTSQPSGTGHRQPTIPRHHRIRHSAPAPRDPFPASVGRGNSRRLATATHPQPVSPPKVHPRPGDQVRALA